MLSQTERSEEKKSTAERGRNSAEAVRKSDAVVKSGGALRHGGAGGMVRSAGAVRRADAKRMPWGRKADPQRGREGPAPTAHCGGAPRHGGGRGRGRTMRPRTRWHSYENTTLCYSVAIWPGFHARTNKHNVPFSYGRGGDASRRCGANDAQRGSAEASQCRGAPRPDNLRGGNVGEMRMTCRSNLKHPAEERGSRTERMEFQACLRSGTECAE